MEQKKHKILLVEDEEPVVLVLGKALTREGYEVTTAGDGEKGKEIALREHPDVIIADLMLPKMSGMDMIRAIRNDAWGKGVAIIILTNVVDENILAEAMHQETFYYIVKGDSSMAHVLSAVRSRLK
ncbi:MAG: response regulator [bacterium]|nr:response regulator [bacterium]